jgi:UDP-N-acetylglucosamine/UDP-N-acetylgalactosamine diphosphorylase
VNLEEAKLKLSKYGQEQILRYFDELSDDEKAALLEQIDKTDMEVLSAIEHKSELVKKGEITPLDAMELEEKKALKKEFGRWNNQEEYINCEIENQEEIPF